jgi:hypothetical protein
LSSEFKVKSGAFVVVPLPVPVPVPVPVGVPVAEAELSLEQDTLISSKEISTKCILLMR